MQQVKKLQGYRFFLIVTDVLMRNICLPYYHLKKQYGVSTSIIRKAF
jgi:hypothetical protein